MIVKKFGGTSVQNAEAMNRIYNILKISNDKSIVLLSAVRGITDDLIKLVGLCAEFSACAKEDINDCIFSQNTIGLLLIKIQNVHLGIIQKLDISVDIKIIIQKKFFELFLQLKDVLSGIIRLHEKTKRNSDKVVAFGEMFSTLIFSEYIAAKELNSTFFDIKKVLYVKEDINSYSVDYETTRKKFNDHLSPLLDQYDIIITQGFICSDQDNHTRTLGRGGSDFSAAIIAKTADAEAIEIWTDVSGVFTADPRIVPNAKSIEELSFYQVRELSYFGAKVLHPDTILPAIEANIPIFVLNTFEHNARGTKIISQSSDDKPRINSIVLKENCLKSTFKSFNIESDSHVKKNIFNTINSKNIKNLYLLSSNNIINLLTENTNDVSCLLTELFSTYKGQYLQKNCDIICLSGENLSAIKHSNNAIAERFIHILNKFGSYELIFPLSDNSILVLVFDSSSKDIVLELHKEFFE